MRLRPLQTGDNHETRIRLSRSAEGYEREQGQIRWVQRARNKRGGGQARRVVHIVGRFVGFASAARHMHLNPVACGAQHGGPDVSVGVQSRPSRFLRASRTPSISASVASSFGAHAITPEVYLCSKFERAGHRGHHVRVTAKHPTASRGFRAASRADPVPRATALIVRRRFGLS